MDTAAAAPKPGDRVALTLHVTTGELARLDHMASRLGTTRAALAERAIDALLAQEAWSGGFIEPPPPMEIPSEPAPSRRR